MEKIYISIVGKNLFPQRMHIEKKFGELIYDQIIFVLENIGNEIDFYLNPNNLDIRLGVYLDTANDDTRKFEIDKNLYEKFWTLFANGFFIELKNYSLRQQKLGTNLLFQLNNGTLSIDDFNNKF